MSSSASTMALTDEAAAEITAARQERQADEKTLLEAFDREQLRGDNIDWVVTGFLIAVHLGCLAAPFVFSWQALLVCIGLHWLTCSIGVCLGYHRYLSHKSLKLRSPVEFLVLLAGSLSGEGSPLTWAATHRLHHQKSDQEGDPHSPLVGPWWSHIMWLFPRRTTEQSKVLFRRYIPELVERPMLMFFEKTYAYWLWVGGLAVMGLGYLMGGWPMALSMLVWGMCVRMVASYHTTWFVNSATHLWGYRNYETRDESRNLWWVALLAYGEGWHNNHHAHPSVAPAGHKWYEIDMTYWVIRMLKATGLAYDVRDRIPQGTKANDVEAAELDHSAHIPAEAKKVKTPADQAA